MALNFLVSNERDHDGSDVFAMCVSSDGNTLYTGSANGAIAVWDLESQTLRASREAAFAYGCSSLDSAQDLLVGTDILGTVSIWQESTTKLLIQITSEEDARDPIWKAVLGPDALTLACSTASGALLVYDLTDPAAPTQVARITTRNAFGLCISYSADGKSICTGHKGGGLFLFDTSAGKLRHALGALVTDATAIAFSPGSKMVAAASSHGQINIYDTQTGEQRFSFRQSAAQQDRSGNSTAPASVLSLDWNQTGELLLACDTTGKVKVWHVERAECLCTLTENQGPVDAGRWVKRGRMEGFAVGGVEGKVRFYQPTS